MVWRRLQVPETTTLAELHRVIQVAMGWEDYHLHRFQIHGRDYGGGGFTSGASERVPLSEFAFRPGDTFLYEYDFGDAWEHEVRVEDLLGAAPKSAVPACTGGSRACPPEDSGGPRMYMEAPDVRPDQLRAAPQARPLRHVITRSVGESPKRVNSMVPGSRRYAGLHPARRADAERTHRAPERGPPPRAPRRLGPPNPRRGSLEGPRLPDPGGRPVLTPAL